MCHLFGLYLTHDKLWKKSIFEPCHEKNLFVPYANTKGEDQPAHLSCLISTFVVHCLDCIICILAKSKILGFQLASVAEQTDLSLTGPQTGRHVEVRLKPACTATEACRRSGMVYAATINGLQHDKTNKMTCVPSEDLDQPGHPPSLISLRLRLMGS